MNPFWDELEIEDSFNLAAVGSFNYTETNTETNTAEIGVADSFNTDNSVNDSGNLDVRVRDSFNSDSHDTVGSYNTDNSDHSINAGNREYNTSFGDINLAGKGGGSGIVAIDDRDTIVDQSVNANVAGGFVGVGSSASAVVASGDDSVAVGGDLTQTTTVNASTNIAAGDDVNIGNTTTIDNTLWSNNSYTDNSTDVSVVDSFNDYSATFSVDNSFNEETLNVDVDAWDIDANVIWGSGWAGIDA